MLGIMGYMNATLIASLITAIGALLVATVTYLFTKHKDLEADLRKERLEYYKAFMESLCGMAEDSANGDNRNSYSRACNNLQLFAPVSVVNALDNFLAVKDKSPGLYEEELTALLKAIRHDLGVRCANEVDFKAKLLSP